MTNNVSSVQAGGYPTLAKSILRKRVTRGLLGWAALLCAGMPVTGWAQVFSNATSLDIPRNTVTQGPASLYPDPIMVSGIGTTLTNLTVTFSNLSHDYPDDIDVLLVGPQNQNVLLMSDAGGYFTVAHLNLTFSDAAATTLPDESLIASGTYKPTNYDGPYAPDTIDSFASPAPNVGPYGSTLSVFNGTNPNGVWRLYIVDDEQGNSGTLAGGWSLNVTAVPEPSSLAAGAGALAVMGLVVVRRRRAGAVG